MPGAVDEYGLSLVGKTVGNFRLEECIAQGGIGYVYRAQNPSVGREVAIKVLRPERCLDRGMRRRFESEGLTSNRVRHDGVVKTYDRGVAADGALYLVMELLLGKDLETYRLDRGGSLSCDEVCQIAYEVLEVLEAAHVQKIVHRDIKPANLFLTDTGSVKVLDFGIAKFASEAGSGTGTGQPLGTPQFMAPEQARGERRSVGAKTDLWALGATMFTLVSGQYVHEAPTEQLRLLAAMTRPARSVLEAAPGLSPRIAEVIDRALDGEGDRWGSAATMKAALASAYVEVFGRALVSKAPNVRPSSPRVSRRRRRWMLALAGCFVSVGAAFSAVAAWTWTAHERAAAPRSAPDRTAPALAPANAAPPPDAVQRPAESSSPAEPGMAAPVESARRTAPVAAKTRVTLPSRPAATQSLALDCKVPYYFDDAGNKVFKAKCNL